MRIIDGKRLPSVTDTSIRGFFEDYRFLSNFHPCDVKVAGRIYCSSEHAYMALKTTDEEERLLIRNAATAVEAKRLGQQVTLRPNWDSLRLIAMRMVVLAKFKNTPHLKKKLLDTGDKFLEETNNWGDTFWGVDMRRNKGENHLGLILMSVRSELSL